ncbi:hypothetical protein QN277_012866 [Acacia crassicarpa]|uniref:GST C-terminal domain-containing protein n=1 Tax=Acacia crassicarpa TaxID=499986 RepID=A0AAE1TE65_9FABA|nr:hypothetical protein QN277_012866 [Acacia crassicarpa]
MAPTIPASTGSTRARLWIKFAEEKSIAFMSFYLAQGEEHEKGTKEAKQVLKVLEEQAVGKRKYFAEDEIDLVDLVVGWMARLFGSIEKAVGAKVKNASDFPQLLAWIQNIRENPAIKASLQNHDELLAHHKQKRQMIIASKTA